MTLSGYWLFHVKLSFRTSSFRFRGFDFET